MVEVLLGISTFVFCAIRKTCSNSKIGDCNPDCISNSSQIKDKKPYFAKCGFAKWKFSLAVSEKSGIFAVVLSESIGAWR